MQLYYTTAKNSLQFYYKITNDKQNLNNFPTQ